MANFAIMRLKKLKSSAAVKGMAKHNFRTIKTPNADLERTILNDHRACTGVFEVMQRYKELLPEKVRKNAVHAIDYMITTSPEVSKKDNEIAIEEGIKWVEDRHGKENILISSIHHDETTPHVHIVAMPLLNGKLNAKHFVGGSKHRLSQLQDEYFGRVEHKTELVRGIKGSRAKHKTVAAWNAQRLKALAEAPKSTSKAKLLKDVELTRFDLIRPEIAQNRVSKVVSGVVGERDYHISQVETHKSERIRERTEMIAIRRENRKLNVENKDFRERGTNPELRVMEIKRLIKLDRIYQNAKNRIENFKRRLNDCVQRSTLRTRSARVVERVRPSRSVGREWCPSADLRSGVQTPSIAKEQTGHHGLSRSPS